MNRICNGTRSEPWTLSSLSQLLSPLKEGDDDAANYLWQRLNQRLIKVAKKEVRRTKPTAYDEEDVALSAFGALCHGLKDGRYDGVTTSDQLWRLASVIAINKAKKRAVFENRQRRGGHLRRIENTDQLLEAVQSKELSVEERLAMNDECRRLLDLLKRTELQLVAILKVEGYTNEETAKLLGCTRRSVQRRIVLIKKIWANELENV